MKRLPILLYLLLTSAAPCAGQVIAFRSAALAGHWYAPELGLYAENATYGLDFSGSYLTEVQLEFEILQIATLRTSIGHWQNRSTADLHVDDPSNARRHEGTLRIVPLSATLLFMPSLGAGPRPVLGAGISQNLIQRSFERVRLDGSEAPEQFSGNGRDFSAHAVAGVHVPLARSTWAGVEARYVWGRFEEEQILSGTPTAVSLDGLQLGLSIRYELP